AIRLSLPARWCALRACARPAPLSPRPMIRTRKFPAIMAASFRFPLPGAAGARDGVGTRALAHLARAGTGMAEDPGMAQCDPSARPAPGREFSARQSPLPGLLSL